MPTPIPRYAEKPIPKTVPTWTNIDKNTEYRIDTDLKKPTPTSMTNRDTVVSRYYYSYLNDFVFRTKRCYAIMYNFERNWTAFKILCYEE